MTPQDIPQKQTQPESMWTLGGVLLGTVVGSIFGDVGFGISIGLIIGSVVTMTLERKRKKRSHSLLILAVGFVAAVCLITIRIVGGK